ncbi:MAG: PASTA domain-containing protein [Bacteroidetes bacterium]|nr:MAG: PASTA domain-containing protein [Bacteroidota bacterium]
MLNIKNEVLVRLYLLAAAVLLGAVVISGRLYQLSVVQAPKWEAKADSLFLKFVDVRADRGNILASDGSLLATSLPFFDVHFDAKAEGLTDEAFMENLDSLSWMLSTYIDQQYTPGAYKDWLLALRNADPSTRGIRYVPIARDLPYNKMQLVKQFPLFRLGRYKGGLIVEQKSKRERPFKLLAQRTIGYVREGALPVGLEGSFDKVLGGNMGKQLMLRVPGDVYIPVNDLAEIEPNSGDDIVTTLDINIQDVAERALLDACKAHEADHGCAVVMEVKTGAIRAIANIGRIEEGWWEKYNYAVGERVEPGSMFKLASFMAMLEDGFVDDFNEQVPVYQGKVKFYDEELVDATRHGLDSMSILEIFAQSSNVGTATLVQKYYGDNRKAAAFVDRLKSFGLARPTEIEIGGEEAPVLKSPEDNKSGWSGTTLPWMSIGYEMLLTPLQLLTFYNAVANDGRMMKPYLVERVENYGETIKEFRPVTLKRSIASRKTIRKAKELLTEVVNNGTARNIRTDLFQIAGKTGTAQLNYHKFKPAAGIRHQAGFCGFFPADNPVYSCIVVISEPKRGGYHGAEAAAPVFREIAKQCYALKGELHPPVNSQEAQPLPGNQLPVVDAGSGKDLRNALDWLDLEWYGEKQMPEWGVLKPEKDSLMMLPRLVSEKKVPLVVGMGLKDAVYLLENRGCRVRVKGVGKVARQSLAPGTVIHGRRTIVLYLN